MAYQNLLILASFILLYSVFAIMVLEVDLPHQSTIILTLAFTIVLSVVLLGFTAKPLIKGLTDRKAQAN